MQQGQRPIVQRRSVAVKIISIRFTLIHRCFRRPDMDLIAGTMFLLSCWIFPSCSYMIILSDTPMDLALSALQAIPAVTGTNGTSFAWTVYTGDLVSHDPEYQLSRYVPAFLFDCTIDLLSYAGNM